MYFSEVPWKNSDVLLRAITYLQKSRFFFLLCPLKALKKFNLKMLFLLFQKSIRKLE